METNYSKIKTKITAFACLIGFSFISHGQTTYTLNYTGSVQNLNLLPGSYQIECWGADGSNGSWTNVPGGKGGYSIGTYMVSSAATIYVCVGGVGFRNTISLGSSGGGYNGGGNGYDTYGTGGGGATHVSTASGLLSNTTVRSGLIIAAGGGGGASGWAGTPGLPGNGGGLNGSAGTPALSTSGTGGTQTAGGTQATTTYGNANGTAGVGGSGLGNQGCGGGGGWYGGGGAPHASNGGGGSGYIVGVTSATTAEVSQPGFVTKPAVPVAGNGIVIVKELCSITLTASGPITSGAICTGNSVTLTTNAISNYTWSTGAITSSIVVSPTSTTVYSLTATSPSNCTASAALTITVNGTVPTLTVSNTAVAGGICPTKTVNLNAIGAITYTWTGATPTITNGVTFSPLTGGDYTVVGTNGCGTGSAVTSVSVHPLPTVNPATSASTLCSGLSITLTATGNSTNYAWSGHSSPITGGVGFSPVLTATYTVIGTSALSCTAAATIPVTVVTTPVALPVASPILICIGGSSTLTATGATNYTWTSSTQTVYTSSLVATPSTTGVSSYTVTKANSNCVDTRIISVTTNSLPTIFAIVSPTLVCALSPATLAVGGGQTYTWTASTSTTPFNGPSPVVYPPSPTNYTVAASDGTCINTTTVALAVDPNPTITTVPTSSTICLGQAVTINANGGNNYTVTSTAGGNFNTPSITQSPTATIAYTFIGDNVFGCTSSALQVVIVNPNPTITAVANRVLVCSGNPSTLTANGAATYTWTSNNALTNTTIVNPTSLSSAPVIFNVAGSYTTGCQSSKTVAVNVFVPVLTVSGNTNTCVGGLITLAGGGGNAGSYSWNTGSGTSNFQTLTTTLSAASVFTLSATSTSVTTNCPATKTVAVGLYTSPVITASAVAQRTTICQKESVDLYGQGGVSYAWSTSANTATITVSPAQQTTYTVTGTDANGCVSTGTIQVKVSNCVGINELSNSNNGLMVYPNPNNGEFSIQSGSDITLSLVNELGQVIRTFNLTEANDHKISVTNLSKGIYFISGQKENVQIYQKVIVTR